MKREGKMGSEVLSAKKAGFVDEMINNEKRVSHSAELRVKGV